MPPTLQLPEAASAGAGRLVVEHNQDTPRCRLPLSQALGYAAY